MLTGRAVVVGLFERTGVPGLDQLHLGAVIDVHRGDIAFVDAELACPLRMGQRIVESSRDMRAHREQRLVIVLDERVEVSDAIHHRERAIDLVEARRLVLGPHVAYRGEAELHGIAQPVGDVEELTGSVEPEVERLEKAGFAGKSALVQSVGESSTYRAITHYRASRMYARVGIQGGLYYLGNAHASLELASLCARMDDAHRGTLPSFRPLADFEAELSKSTVSAYGQGDASTTHHRDFIRLDSALKERVRVLCIPIRWRGAR